MDSQPLALEPIGRNIQRISPVRMFHHVVDIAPGIPGRVFGFVESPDPREAESLVLAIEKALASSVPCDGVSFDDRASELLLAMNSHVADARKKGALHSKGSELSVIAAIAHGVQIAVSGRNATALRIHRDGKSLEATELLPPHEKTANALFSTLVVGGMGGRDALLLSGRRLLDYIARDHLSRIVANSELESVRETILAALADLDASVSLAAYVVKPATPRARAVIPDQSASSMDSLDDLLGKASTTERLLHPSLQIPIVRKIRGLFPRNQPRLPLPTSPVGRSRQTQWQKHAVRKLGDMATIIAAALKSSASGIHGALVSIMRIVGNRDGARAQEFAAIRSRTVGAFTFLKSQLSSLPIAARLALVSGLAAGIIFSGSIVAIGRSQAKSEREIAYQTALTAIEDKRDAIEASAIYSDSSRAWVLLDEARTLVAALPVETNAQQETVDRQTGLLEEESKKLRKEISIENPELASTIPSEFENERRGTTAVWNDREYALDPEGATITREGTPWVKGGGEDLRDALSITIDGSVFVGTSSGKILKYHLGDKTDFAPGRVEPALKSITRILAPAESAYLYLLVPETKRVVVLIKETGALAAQYTSPAFDALSDIVVDESKKTVYLKNGTAVFAVPLGHL